MVEHTAFIGLGSNLGDRIAHLAAARKFLRKVMTITRASSIYETEPVDVQDQPCFLNQVLMVQCTLDPFQLLRTCLAIELGLGRKRVILKGPRTLDLDILLYDDLALHQERNGFYLIIPHPRLHLRRFVLQPLCEIAPEQLHPILGQTFAQLLTQLGDPSWVRRTETSEER